MVDAETLRAFGRQFGIDAIRITTAEPFIEAGSRIKEQRDAGFYLESERWPRRDIDRFCDVRRVLPGARSIIAACQCYLTSERPSVGASGNPHGLVARYTWRNHYADLRDRLKRVADLMTRKYRARCMVFSNGEIAEKPIAQRSGTGFYGKNSIIINPRYGSWIVLGEIITDMEIEPDSPLDIDCGPCRKCIDACPTGAIVRPYVIDRRSCIQALTNWYGVLPDEISRVWSNRLYGCSDCQESCPRNTHVPPGEARTDIGHVGPSIGLRDILEMSAEDYRTRYARNQMGERWIHFKAIQRNALVSLGNIRDPDTVPLLERYAGCDDPVLAQTSRWSLSRF